MTKTDLIARYPYMFPGPNTGHAIGDGWVPILAEACEKIDALLGPDKRGFHFTRIKEKFGSGRFYCGGESVPRELWISIHEALHVAEQKTQTVCMRCSAPAQIQRYSSLYACVCEEHAKELMLRQRQPRSAK